MASQVQFYNSIRWSTRIYIKRRRKNFNFFYFFKKIKKNPNAGKTAIYFFSHISFFFVIGCVISIGFGEVKAVVLRSGLDCACKIQFYLLNRKIYGSFFYLIKIQNCFSIGDLIVCKIEKRPRFEVTTTDANLGVLLGSSICGHFLIPENNYEMKSYCNFKKKLRKVSNLSLW